MKTKFTVLCLLTLIILLGCNKEERETFNYVEAHLPGHWEIVEIEINQVLWQRQYKGDKIKKGDIFYNFGEITIPEFDIDIVKQNNNTIPVHFQITDNIVFEDVYLKRLFLSVEPDEYYMWFDPLNFIRDNDVANVLFASQLFGTNMKMKFIDEDEIEMSLLGRPNRLKLKRK